MEQNKIFCQRCEQRINTSKGFLGLGKPAMRYYEFKDGYYCEKCGQVQVEEKRKKENDKSKE